MPYPIARPGSGTVQPHPKQQYLRQQENWAITQERMRHAQALHQVGEYAMFVLMWSLIDFQAGLVARCTRCYGGTATVQHRIADVYNQPTQNECPRCFGTTFDGGIRAKIVRPTIWADADEKEKLVPRGVVHPERVSVETTWDFRMRQGDFIFRADGSRWRVPDSPQRVTLRTGYKHPSQAQTSLTYHRIEARHEEKGTVAYLIPPVPDALKAILAFSGYEPVDFTSAEQINAPLIPADSVMD